MKTTPRSPTSTVVAALTALAVLAALPAAAQGPAATAANRDAASTSAPETASAITAGGRASKRASRDPGSAPWEQVPRDRVAAECGLDPDLLEQASLRMPHTPFVIVRYGKLCWTGGYPTGYDTPYQVWSITKTLGALLFGMVADRSSLSDTDRVTEWIPPEVIEDKGINPKARLAHVLSMTSTKSDLRYGEKGEWSYDTTGEREINTLVAVMNRAIEQEPEGFPGVRTVKEFAEKELFEPLGMRDSSWPGEVIGGTMVSSQEDLGRMALLILRRGVWDGRRLVSERYLYRMTHPAFEDTNTGYGYLTYANAHDSWVYSTGTADLACSPFTTWPRYPHAPLFEAPDDNGGSPYAKTRHDIGLAWAAGAGGQKTSIHRGLDLVISVRDDALSVQGDSPGTFEGHQRVWDLIRPALVALDPAFDGDEEAFCAAYERSAYAPDLLDPWSRKAGGPRRAGGSSRR
jgi:CubicO group peptidase (beta-lactamase class C family)